MSDEFSFQNPGDLPEEEAEKLQELFGRLANNSRKIGLYMDEAVMTMAPGTDGQLRKVIVAHYTIGDVAFATRVQDPKQDSIDKQFQEMATGMVTHEFNDLRERMARNIAAGRDPMDDGDASDSDS